VLSDLPSIVLDQSGRREVVHGRPVKDGGGAGPRGRGEAVALLGDGALIAVARAEDGWLRPTVVLEAP
jgi:hypothetical protein